MPVQSGIDAKYFAKVESTLDTQTAFAATDGVPLLDLKFEPELEYHRSKEHHGDASLEDEIKGLQRGKWSATAYVRPSTSAGTAPDIGEMLRAALGTETVSPGTSVTYSLSTPLSLQLLRQTGTTLQEVVTGAVVEEVTIECLGNDEPTITFSGTFCSYAACFGGTTTATVSSSATTFTLSSATAARMIQTGGAQPVIKIGTDDNSGAGYRVTAANTGTGAVTFTPALGVTQTGATTIEAFSPTPTIAGTILGGVDCDQTIGGSSVGFISSKHNIKLGTHLLDKEANATRPNRIARGMRDWTGEINGYFLEDQNGPVLGKAWAGSLAALVLRVGSNTAARRMKVNNGSARVGVTPIEIPEAEEATVNMKWVAHKVSTANDEGTIVFD